MERERLRLAAAGERQAKRREDLSQLMDINLATDIKVGHGIAGRHPAPTHLFASLCDSSIVCCTWDSPQTGET